MTPRALFHPARLARKPVLSTQSDERLVDLVRAGSDPAFEAIVERYRRALMRYVSRLLPPERAEDVVQQAFVKAYEAMHRDAAELNLRPWLYRIAHNGAVNALRDRALGHAQLDERFDGVERPDQALERTLGLRDLVVAVQALPERQRNAILLRELEGRSYGEIAAALGVTDGAVRQLLNRARNSLRAAAAAVLPVPLVTRLAGAESTEPITARIAELTGVGGSALAMKLCATALVTGAVVGGAAVMPDAGREQSGGAPAAAAEAVDETTDEDDAGAPESPLESDENGGSGTSEARGDDDSSGRRSGSGDDGEDHSGSGRRGDDGGRRDDGRSGDDVRDRSGPGGDDRSGSRDGGDRSGPGGGELVTTPDDQSGAGGGTESVAEEEEPTGGTSGPGGGGETELERDTPELDSPNSDSGSSSDSGETTP
jgi:RNA polymerase sigma factor (sigma-70 family)